MAIEKIRKGEQVPYVQVSNNLLNDNTLLLKEKGLLAYMLSKPEDWHFHVKAMAAELRENKDTVAKILRGLIEANYVHREEIREGGKIKGFIYSVYQSPHPKTSDTVESEAKLSAEPCPNSPCPKTSVLVSSDNTKKYSTKTDPKKKEKELEGEGDVVSSTTRAPSPPETTAPPVSLSGNDKNLLFDRIKETRKIYSDSPPRLSIEERLRAEAMSLKYGMDSFIAWLDDSQRQKPNARLSFLFEDFGSELRNPQEQGFDDFGKSTTPALPPKPFDPDEPKCPSCGAGQYYEISSGAYGCSVCYAEYGEGRKAGEYFAGQVKGAEVTASVI